MILENAEPGGTAETCQIVGGLKVVRRLSVCLLRRSLALAADRGRPGLRSARPDSGGRYQESVFDLLRKLGFEQNKFGPEQLPPRHPASAKQYHRRQYRHDQARS